MTTWIRFSKMAEIHPSTIGPFVKFPSRPLRLDSLLPRPSRLPDLLGVSTGRFHGEHFRSGVTIGIEVRRLADANSTVSKAFS
jgi:hypothetical protein